MATYGTLTADGDTDTVYVNGPFTFQAVGTWGSGTITLTYTIGGVDYTVQTDVAMTSDSTGEALVEIPSHPAKIPVVGTLSGSSSPDLNWVFLGNVSDNANP